MDRVILHCDANNFYASVECQLNPELRGKAIAVCGSLEDRHGIVLAKSEPAKKLGVKTGDVIWQAKLKCPDLIIAKPHYDEYVRYSNRLFSLYTEYTDKVEPFGLDECWLDVTHSKIFGDGVEIADTLRERVKKELGITISCGVSFNKVFAKLGSDYKKPDATTVISRENFISFTENMDISDMIMIGRKTALALHKFNIKTLGELRTFDKNILKQTFGVNGVMLYNWANGMDNAPVNFYYNVHIPKSIGNGITAYKDLENDNDAFSVMRALTELVSTRLLHYDFNCATITLYLKFNDFNYFMKSCAINPTNNASRLFNKAKELYYYNKNKTPIRAVRISTSNLEIANTTQLELFDPNILRDHELDIAIDKIKTKYGYKSIQPASTIIDSKLCQNIETSDFKPFKR